MLTGFLSGLGGGMLCALGVLFILMGLFGWLMGGPAAFFWLLLGFGTHALGSYLRYVSRQTVQLADKRRG